LYTVREGIANDLEGFKKAYSDKRFRKVFGEILGSKNKIVPKEFREAAEKEPLLLNKQWYFYAQFEPDLILSDQLEETILDCFEAGKPVEHFFSKLIKR